MLAKLQNDSTVVLAGGATGAVWGLFIPDAFFWLFLILLGTNGADYILGRHAARAARIFDRTKSRNGVASKASQLVVVLALRSLEAVVPTTGLPSTLGLASAALCLALIVEDVESVERHGRTLGGGPIPGLSPILRRLRVLTGGESRLENGEGPPEGVEERRVGRRAGEVPREEPGE